mgnify:CR=1 FL=1
MIQLTDEELLRYMKACGSEVNTLAEIHKVLIQSNIKCNIEELRHKIFLLHRDGYIGNEPTGDGVNMYYIIFNPQDITENSET